ncbi:MAG TPA: ABC transporter substrate-binding protein [Acidimicrobiales bacterium]|nr:ABC transporter substrate-binding protein [Acidimicrobiales bacterium]
MNVSERLGRLRSRGQTYGFVLGVVCSLLVATLAVPLIAGDPARRSPDADESVLRFEPAPDTPGTGTVLDASGAPVPAQAAAGSTDSPQTANAPGAVRTGAAPGAVAAVPPGVKLAASDQGVTATRIKIGAVVTDLGGTSALGFNPEGYDPDTQKRYFQAHIDDLNKKGGLLGRQVDLVFATVDILSQDSMRTACQQLADGQKVFAVLHVLGVYGDPILCFTEQKKLPYIAFDGAVADYYKRSNGYLITTQASTLRTSLDMAKRLHDAGELRGKKVGILRYAEYLDGDMTSLINYTRGLGSTVIDAEISVSNTGAVPGQLAIAVNRFQTENVGIVFLMTNTLYGQQFVSQAERQSYFPAYAVSDFDYASAGDSFVSGMPDAFFRRALIVTSTRIGDTAATATVDKECNAVAVASVGKPLAPPDGEFYGYLGACGLLRTFLEGMSRGGPNPTRAGFVKAMQTVGAFPNPGFAGSSLGPNKLGAASEIRIAQALLSCKCWKPATGYSPTAFAGS